ncbi:MAG TPA: M13 family metallopeptidase [Pyrinomonadaceae bacterium]|jgi:endothelin-converting enzyme/putative endopeptidase
MSLIRILIVTFILSATVLAQNPAQRGIEVSDLNRSVSACDDFYEFANGGWRAANPIPASMPRWSRRWAAGETTKDKLKEILEEVSAAKSSPKGSVEQLTGDFYSACMDEAQANRLGVKPVQPLLADIDRMRTRADVQRMIARFHEISINVPFGLFGRSDNHSPRDVIAQIYASGLGLPDRDYYVKPEQRFKEAREKYLAHVAKIFTLAGYDEARAKAAANAVFQMELRLAQASLDNVQLRDPQATDHKTSFAALQKLTPDFDWTNYYRQLGLRSGDLNINEPKFLEEFNRLLKAAPVDDWKTYLKWHLLNSAAPSLSDEFVQADFAFYGAYLSGAKEIKPRWKRCVEETDNLLGEALGKKYVEKYFPPEAKARMQEMVKNLRAAMGETIQGLEWMSPATKQRALEKLSTFNPKIGYPDKWKDYSRVPITRSSYWEDVVAGRKFAVRDNLSQIGKPVDRSLWGMTPPTSDAYYDARLNEIVFPAGILQPPAFNIEANDAVNYGAIGVVIGHEFSHGFDDEGAQYDAQGRLKNWWTDEDLKKFQARTSCVVNQFDNYFVEPGLHHNGKLVLGESIGDLAGAKIAFRAFQISRRGKPPLQSIDGFTPEQQFFIAWGQFRGDAVRPEFARTMVQGDPHPIGKYRVIGPLSNMPEFQQAFQCREGSPMVRPPAERCEVW